MCVCGHWLGREGGLGGKGQGLISELGSKKGREVPSQQPDPERMGFLEPDFGTCCQDGLKGLRRG